MHFAGRAISVMRFEWSYLVISLVWATKHNIIFFETHPESISNVRHKDIPQYISTLNRLKLKY